MTDVNPNPSPSPNPAPNPAPNPSPTPPKPWFEGKATAEEIGHWDNKGWKKDDPIEIAIQATKAAREAQRFVGVPPERLLKLPERADDAAGWRAVHERLGAPQKAEDYDFGGMKYADGTDAEQGFVDTVRAFAFKHGLTKEASRELATDLIKYSDSGEAQAAGEAAAQRASNLAELNKLWGANTELNRLRAMEGARRLGLSEEATKLIEGQIGYVNLMEAMRKIGVGTSEDTFTESGQGGNPTTANGAKARLAELQADPEWRARFLDPKAGAAEKREFANLMQMIHGAA